MQFAEMADTFFGPIWIVPQRPGCSQAGPPGDDLQRLHRGARGCEHRKRVGLCIEHVDRSARARPMAARAVGLCERAADAASRR